MLERLSRTHLVLIGAAGAVIALGAIAAILGGVIVASGVYNTSADARHGWLVAWALHTTMMNSVRARAKGDAAPQQFSEEQVREGFAAYEDHCVMCHGGPGLTRAQWVKGLEPTPPYLLDAAARWSPGELRYIIKHGVKMTAMPAWGLSRPESEITALVAFLEKLPAITPQQYRAMRTQRGH